MPNFRLSVFIQSQRGSRWVYIYTWDDNWRESARILRTVQHPRIMLPTERTVPTYGWTICTRRKRPGHPVFRVLFRCPSCPSFSQLSAAAAAACVVCARAPRRSLCGHCIAVVGFSW